MSRALVGALALVVGCAAAEMSDAQKSAVRAEIEATLKAAYDLSQAGVEERMLSLYPASGRVVSASAGRASTSRDTLAAGIRYFWQAIGVNMINPTWVWDSIYVDVLSPTSAVLTANYRIPHHTPRHQPHVIAGAMTALFARRDGKWVILQEHLSDLPAAAASDTSHAHPASRTPQ